MPIAEHTNTKTSLQDFSDGNLAQKSLDGDQRAFEMLVERYRPLLFNCIHRILGDYDQSCDILQQVFLQLYISLPTLQQDKSLRAWLLRVARNRCLDELRRKRSIPFSTLESVGEEDEMSLLVSFCDPNPLPEEVAERHDLRSSVQRAIEGLPLHYRRVVLLRYAGQQSFAEIGQALSIPAATAKTYFQRAKPLLRAALTSEMPQQLATVN
ncbi:MAG TPA: sigma-70 family RNA polymerase sigma factor [Ktedonobacteraceae bacterium]|nr:sigma-70 family RNA polymerase sigma factor [Ktedonobacteraceae bacterium]